MIVSRIYEWARLQPEKTALFHNDTATSYAAFAKRIEATRRFLGSHNLPVGRTAVVLAHNLADAWVVVLALRSLGLNTICVNSIADAEALKVPDVACVVTTQAELPSHSLQGNLLAGTIVLAVPQHLLSAPHDADLILGAPSDHLPGGYLIYTSGTTGSFKKLFRNGFEDEIRELFWADRSNININTVHHGLMFPLWTGAGSIFPLCTWRCGGTIMLSCGGDWREKVFDRSFNSIFVTPAFLKSIVEEHNYKILNSTKIRMYVSGAPLSYGMARAVLNNITSDLRIMYGMSESFWFMDTLVQGGDDLIWYNPPGDGVYEIVDDQDRPCAVGEEGFLRIKLLPFDAPSYLDDAESTAKFFRDGYFYPGDMAERRADGRIRILGRVVDVLNVQGFKVAVAPLERRAQDLLGVENVCLFSGLNDQGSEELVVAIEALRMPPQSDLSRVYQEFSRFERVRFELLREFPRTEAGMKKIKRAELRKLIFRKSEFQIRNN